MSRLSAQFQKIHNIFPSDGSIDDLTRRKEKDCNEYYSGKNGIRKAIHSDFIRTYKFNKNSNESVSFVFDYIGTETRITAIKQIDKTLIKSVPFCFDEFKLLLRTFINNLVENKALLFLDYEFWKYFKQNFKCIFLNQTINSSDILDKAAIDYKNNITPLKQQIDYFSDEISNLKCNIACAERLSKIEASNSIENQRLKAAKELVKKLTNDLILKEDEIRKVHKIHDFQNALNRKHDNFLNKTEELDAASKDFVSKYSSVIFLEFNK